MVPCELWIDKELSYKQITIELQAKNIKVHFFTVKKLNLGETENLWFTISPPVI